ncbi:MAG: hypothetical protein K0A93_13555 [Desulfuromonadaceae bacterium]|nr:hypothetical protein [Desulfuromonadaceae bacterium]
MRELINTVLRWLAKNVVTLVVVIAILIGGGFIKQKWDEFEIANDLKLAQLNESRTVIEEMRKEAEMSVAALVPSTRATEEQIEDSLKGIKQQLDNAQIKRKELWDTSSLIDRKNPTSLTFRKLIELDIQIKLLEQANSYTNQLYKQAKDHVQSLKYPKDTLAKFVAEKKRIDGSIRANIAALKKLSGQPVPFKERAQIWVWPPTWPPIYRDRRVDPLEVALAQLNKNKAKVQTDIAKQEKLITILTNTRKALPFKVLPFEAEGQRQLESEIEKLKKQLDDNWFQRAAKPVIKALPTALGIVFLIIVTPIAIKLFMFYVIAPLAARRPGIRLLPGSSGLIQFGANDEVKRTGIPRASTVSKSIILDDKSELLVHPEFLQSASLAAKKETKWLLDWTMPLTSLASGMYGLTRVYPDGSEPVVISSSQDPLLEISEIDLPAGSAVVLQPRCLVGIVQRPDDPVCIKGYWRFGLSNWLTMQLRYVVFHGPARLIVKGCRGIRIEPVNTGRAINQAAMLGFSANLQYAVTRCETFGSYLMGKQELFNDRFSGKPGCCIYEETPHPNARTGVTGRGIEGVIDSLLKVFGI